MIKGNQRLTSKDTLQYNSFLYEDPDLPTEYSFPNEGVPEVIGNGREYPHNKG